VPNSVCRRRAGRGCGSPRSGGTRRDTFDAFDEVVDRLGGAVADVGVVPGHDLRLPTGDRAPKTTNLGWHPALTDVASDLVDPLTGDRGVGVLIDLTDDFLGGPRCPHLEVRDLRR
jgi:hypothetical protein